MEMCNNIKFKRRYVRNYLRYFCHTLSPTFMLHRRKNVIMTCTNKCKGMCKLNVVLNMEILLHLINRLLLEQAWH